MRWSHALLGAVLSALAPGFASGAAPPYVNVQGLLETTGGQPANGTYDLVLTLHDAQSGGSQLHSASAPQVAVQGGLFDLVLGPLPEAVFTGAGEVWLQVAVSGEPPMPRRRVLSSAFAIAAAHAAKSGQAADVACSGCVGSSEVDFVWAKGASKGGAAADIECTGCVTALEIGQGVITSAHVQDGGLSAADVGFPWAAAGSPGGPASGLVCTGCVESADLAANLSLSGSLGIAEGVLACQSGTPGCAVALSSVGGLVDRGDGFLTVQTPDGLRVTTAAGTAWQSLEAGALAVNGSASVTGDLGVGGASAARLTLVNSATSQDLLRATSAGVLRMRVRGDGFVAIGGTGPNAALDVTAGHQIQIQHQKPELVLLDTQAGGRQFRVHSGRAAAGVFGVYDATRAAEALTIDGAGLVSVPGGLAVAGDVALSGVTSGLRVESRSSAPGACDASRRGFIYFDTAASNFFGCDGAQWVAFGNGPLGTQGNPGRSCLAVRSSGVPTTGLYWIDPDGSASGAPFQAYCDMTTDGGGWTLVAKVNVADQYNMSEPHNWFNLQLNTANALSPDMVRNQGLASLGASRLVGAIEQDSLARFEVIAEDDFNQRGVWYKRVNAGTFAQWFHTDPTATLVCTNVAMTSNCSNGRIVGGEATNLDGMLLSHYGYPSGTCPLHLRLDGDGAPQYTAVCSCTGDANGNQWHDNALDGHWGNGLLVWLR